MVAILIGICLQIVIKNCAYLEGNVKITQMTSTPENIKIDYSQVKSGRSFISLTT